MLYIWNKLQIDYTSKKISKCNNGNVSGKKINTYLIANKTKPVSTLKIEIVHSFQNQLLNLGHQLLILQHANGKKLRMT